MQEVRTEIYIATAPARVWTVLTNFDGWKDWNPIINHASGDPKLGSKLSIVMRNKDGKDGPKYEPVITGFEIPRALRWRAKMLFESIFTNDKFFELQSSGTGTKLIHSELFSGVMVPLVWSKIEESVPPMLNSMNEALKKKIEASHP